MLCCSDLSLIVFLVCFLTGEEAKVSNVIAALNFYNTKLSNCCVKKKKKRGIFIQLHF